MNNKEYITEDYLPLIEHTTKYLLESYTKEEINNFTDEQLINELFGGAGLLSKIAKNTNLQQQLGGLAAAQAMKTKGAQQAFIGDVRKSLRGESGIKGFLTRNIAGIENIRLKRREEALKALQTTPDIKSPQNIKKIGVGNFAAQQQRKAFGLMSVEKDLVRQAGAEAIKKKADEFIQRNPVNALSMVKNLMANRNTAQSDLQAKERLNRIRQTGLGPPSIYQTPKQSELSKMISFYKLKNIEANNIEREEQQSNIDNILARRDAEVSTTEPVKLYKTARPLYSRGRSKISSSEYIRRRREYIPDFSEPVRESTIILNKLIKEAVDKSSMKCNKPVRSTSPGKKMMVKACEGGQEKIVHFGAKGYGHNYSDAARKSFRARHKCGEKKSKLSAQYWACKKLWAGPKGSKASCPPGRKCKY